MAAGTAVSPLAVPLPELEPISGVRLGAAAAGIRYTGRTDLFMAAFAAGTTVAGVFTKNKCPGAPVDWCRAALAGGRARALVVNAGNANVFTGQAGREATQATAAAAAYIVGCQPSEVFLASTGVIGQTLPYAKITAALPDLAAQLSPDGLEAAARGMMTTDTFPKAATRTADIGGTQVRITGIAKGSGMIAPDMATMLCFIFTDAAVPPPCCRRCWHPRWMPASTASPWMPTRPPATRCCCSPPVPPAILPKPAWMISPHRCAQCCWIWR